MKRLESGLESNMTQRKFQSAFLTVMEAPVNSIQLHELTEKSKNNVEV